MEIEQVPEFRTPHTIDFVVNGACNLDCHWCWGPEHDFQETLSLNDWKIIATNAYDKGTRSIVFTGGEPFMKDGLIELLSFSHSLGIRNTLSTNGILLKRNLDALLYISDLGIPLDGYNQLTNNQMRQGTKSHFQRSIEAIKIVQKNFHHIDLTIRTVVAKPNLGTINLIGNTMLENDVDPSRIRWKLYQVNPVGPRKSNLTHDNWLISDQEYHTAIDKLLQDYGSVFRIQAQFARSSIGRYLIVYPDGNSHVLIDRGDGMPTEKAMGNIRYNFDSVLANINTNETMNNTQHG